MRQSVFSAGRGDFVTRGKFVQDKNGPAEGALCGSGINSVARGVTKLFTPFVICA